uniref:Uncharacterized protein n=1 Tax=Anguilla anguilla TaxID=7936 RepID=A0A0E9UIT5_ANGAN
MSLIHKLETLWSLPVWQHDFL